MKLDGEVKVDTKWFNTINAGGIKIGGGDLYRFPGMLLSSAINVHLVKSGPDFLILRDTSIFIKREALNCFIFCMSCVKDIAECDQIFEGYDDRWGIKASDIEDFATDISYILIDAVREGHETGNFILPEGTDLENLDVMIEWGQVMYVPRVFHITKANNDSLMEFMDKMRFMTLIKPPIPFAKEKEFRFQFTFISSGIIIEPTQNHIIIDAHRLQKYVL